MRLLAPRPRAQAQAFLVRLRPPLPAVEAAGCLAQLQALNPQVAEVCLVPLHLHLLAATRQRWEVVVFLEVAVEAVHCLVVLVRHLVRLAVVASLAELHQLHQVAVAAFSVVQAQQLLLAEASLVEQQQPRPLRPAELGCLVEVAQLRHRPAPAEAYLAQHRQRGLQVEKLGQACLEHQLRTCHLESVSLVRHRPGEVHPPQAVCLELLLLAGLPVLVVYLEEHLAVLFQAVEVSLELPRPVLRLTAEVFSAAQALQHLLAEASLVVEVAPLQHRPAPVEVYLVRHRQRRLQVQVLGQACLEHQRRPHPLEAVFLVQHPLGEVHPPQVVCLLLLLLAMLPEQVVCLQEHLLALLQAAEVCLELRRLVLRLLAEVFSAQLHLLELQRLALLQLAACLVQRLQVPVEQGADCSAQRRLAGAQEEEHCLELLRQAEVQVVEVCSAQRRLVEDQAEDCSAVLLPVVQVVEVCSAWRVQQLAAPVLVVLMLLVLRK